MKVILSRKGFDSENGGYPSPILPNGHMISFPIPSEEGNYYYSDLHFENGKKYSDILQEIDPGNKWDKPCHLDPDLRKEILIRPDEWRPAFGQIGAAETHLENKKVSVGDIFLFFGWFRKVEIHNDCICYINSSENLSIIYGYLQIGKILKREDVKLCPWHPHADDNYIYKSKGDISNNTIYVASDRLIIDGHDMGMPGAGTFEFADNLVLNEKGMSRSKWKLNEVFGKVQLSYHSEKSIKEGYFQSAKKGQEFVFEEDLRVKEWAKAIFASQKPAE